MVSAGYADEKFDAGRYSSFAATLSQPGWSYESTFYYATAAASAGRRFARGGEVHTGVLPRATNGRNLGHLPCQEYFQPGYVGQG
jgi:hypothetical protein